MSPTPPNPPTLCEDCGKAYAVKAHDPDGKRRCITHSMSDLSKAKRAIAAAKGKAAGERQRGVSAEQRAEAANDHAPLRLIRSKHDQAKASKEKQDKAPIAPIPLDTKAKRHAFIAQIAGGQLSHLGAQDAAALVRAALANDSLEEAVPPEQEVIGFRVERVDRSSKARVNA